MGDAISRREFAKTLGVTAAGIATAGRYGGAAGWGGSPAEKTPHVNFPTAARDRLAVAAWPFRAYIDSQIGRASGRERV